MTICQRGRKWCPGTQTLPALGTGQVGIYCCVEMLFPSGVSLISLAVLGAVLVPSRNRFRSFSGVPTPGQRLCVSQAPAQVPTRGTDLAALVKPARCCLPPVGPTLSPHARIRCGHRGQGRNLPEGPSGRTMRVTQPQASGCVRFLSVRVVCSDCEGRCFCVQK